MLVLVKIGPHSGTVQDIVAYAALVMLQDGRAERPPDNAQAGDRPVVAAPVPAPGPLKASIGEIVTRKKRG
jgi:hypothetical protein